MVFKILCSERKKMGLNHNIICIYNDQYSHKRASVYVEAVYNELSPTKPSRESGWTFPEVSLGCSRSESEHLTEMWEGASF